MDNADTPSHPQDEAFRVLLVDESHSDRQIVRGLVEELGFACLDGESAEDAIRILESGPVAVILMGLRRPGCEGFVTARKIRDVLASPLPPIVLLDSETPGAADFEQIQDLGVADILAGPAGRAALVGKIRNYVTLCAEARRNHRESEQLRLLVHGTTEYAIFLLDPGGHIATWNAGAERLKGYKAHEIIGQHFSRFYPQPEIDRKWPEQELVLAQERGRFEDEGWRLRKDGSRFWANVVITALLNPDGTLRGFSKITRDLTERRAAEENSRRLAAEQAARIAAEQAQARIRAREHQLRLFIEHVPAAVAMLDRDLRFVLVSQRWLLEYGLEAAEVIGRPFHEVLPDAPPDWAAVHQRCLAGATERRGEDAFPRTHGQTIWLRWEALPWIDEQGAIGGIVIFSEDITEQKRHHEALRQQREWLSVTLASIGDAVIATDARGHVTYLNGVATDLTGWSQEDAHGRPLEVVFEILNEQTREPVENPVAKVLREGVVVGLGNHTVLVSRDGTLRPIDDSAAPIRDAAGAIIGVVLIFRDVTEPRRAERELRESESRKSAILETALDCIITCDHQGRVLEFNPAAERTFGYRREEVHGRELSDLIIPAGYRERHRGGMARYLATGDGSILGRRMEFPAIRADGTEFPVELAITRIPHTETPLFTAYLRDISEPKRLERQRNARLAVTQRLSDAMTVQEGVSGVLQGVCENLDWAVGLLWTQDKGHELVCRQTWNQRGIEAAEFLDCSRQCSFVLGEGLPGQVWESRQPVWIGDLSSVGNFRRSPFAERAGLHSAVGCPIQIDDQFLGVIEFLMPRPEPLDPSLIELLGTVAGSIGQFLKRKRSEQGLLEQTATAETLNRINNQLTRELDLRKLVQVVTDEGTQLSGAQFGAFFYNVLGERGEEYTLYTVSGMSPDRFDEFPMPRATPLFAPTFHGEGVVRLDDVTQDPRFGKSAPYFGLPPGHPPVTSYLAVPVISRNGEVLGGLFFGHESPGRFTARQERLLVGVASQAAVAIDNARLYQKAQATAERLNLALSAASLGDWSWDTASDIVTLSERAAEIFGIPSGPAMTWTAMQELIHPEDRERVRQEVARVVADRAPYDIQYRVDRTDGTCVWIGALGRAMYDPHGQSVGMHGIVHDISERKHLEESLRASEEKLRLMADTIPQMAWMTRPDGYVFWYNRRWFEYTGTSQEQVEGWAWQRLLPAELLPAILDRWNHSLVTGEPFDMVFPILGAEGQYRPFLTRVNALRNDAGEILYWFGTNTDVTELRQAREALASSEERLRLALNAGHMGVWDWNIQTGSLKWSDSLELVYGLQPGTFGGTLEDFADLIHPEDRPQVLAALQRAVQERDEVDIEFRNVREDGRIRWISASGRVFSGEDSRPIRMIGVGLDITQRKRAEQLSRFLADASAALALLVDFDSTLQRLAGLAVPHFADWVIVDVLEEGTLRRAVLTHLDPQRLQSARLLDLNFPCDPRSPGGAWDVIEAGRSHLAPALDLDPDNEALARQFQLRSSISVPLTVRGKTTGILTFLISQSTHRYDETDLAVAQDLANRTAIAIENAQLYRELREADVRKDEFLATLAHELRNPLAPIRNGLQVLRLAGIASQTAAETRSMMERQLNQMVRLVDDLLDVSRITRNKLELRKERVRLSAVIHSAVETSRPLIEQFRHQLTVTLAPQAIPLDADPVRLAQVFSNLLNNSAKYTEPGGAIELTSAVDGDQAVVCVRDNGLGIPADAMPRLFQMFSQVDRNLERAQGGLGIGLTLVRRLVEMHGGTVTAHSDGPGRGSEFTVRIPIVKEAAHEPVPEANRNPVPGARRRILVVDDNRDSAQSLSMMLELMGNETRIASDGLAAVETAIAFQPDLIFLDIGLPRLNGYEACQRIRAATGRQSFIVALTGWGQEEDRRRSQEAGFDHHLVKPVDIADLTEILSRKP